MNKLLDFMRANKYAIYWTIAYVCIVWCIMWFMFGFDLFSGENWSRLLRAHLRGFPGFAFMIFLLAAVPLYIATTAIILRTKKSLINISIPKILSRAFTPNLVPDVAPQPAQEPKHDENVIAVIKPETAAPAQPKEQNPSIPPELRGQFHHAKRKIAIPTASATMQTQTAVPTPQHAPVVNTKHADLPLPSDFDSESDMAPVNMSAAPQFRDIDFDSFDTLGGDTDTQTDENADVKQYLESKNINYEIIDDIVTTDKYAIASHTDSDFWIADNDTWFAAGRTRQSPIVAVTRIAGEKNLTPVLYLGADNIMDLETIRGDWNAMGIKIITKLDELV